MKSIVILGCSGSGKDYAVKKAFDIVIKPYSYGTVKAIRKPIVKNGYQYLPELNNTKLRLAGDDFYKYLNNGNTTITTVNSVVPFGLKYFRDNTLCNVIFLDATDEEIRRNMFGRRECTSKQNGKENVYNRALKSRDSLRKKYQSHTQDEVVELIRSLI